MIKSGTGTFVVVFLRVASFFIWWNFFLNSAYLIWWYHDQLILLFLFKLKKWGKKRSCPRPCGHSAVSSRQTSLHPPAWLAGNADSSLIEPFSWWSCITLGWAVWGWWDERCEGMFMNQPTSVVGSTAGEAHTVGSPADSQVVVLLQEE